ncbi:hypothetical protein [Methanosarcina horonobensis]|uniref:hypothetical protein n=1 Tax=Methanosarcina horonobensis TaxID=418008 RepID=UPI0022B87E71|nr:hypothetical protein [Methanosarcina horonobensis]
MSETFKGRKAQEAKISYSVSQLYIEDESTPSTRAKRVSVLKAGITLPRADSSIQTRRRGSTKENTIFPSPPSLLLRSRESFATKAAYLYVPRYLHSFEKELEKLL